MEFEVSIPRYSFNSCALKRSRTHPATGQIQHNLRKFIISNLQIRILSWSPRNLLGDLDKSQLCDSAGADTQLYTSTHPEHFPNAAWCLWNAPFILGFSAYFQQQMHVCTCLLSLSVPITASKDLVLCKCAVCVLQQLLMTAMAKGYHLLPHMQQHIFVEMFFSLLHFAHFFQRWATFSSILTCFSQTRVTQDRHTQIMQHKSQIITCSPLPEDGDSK